MLVRISVSIASMVSSVAVLAQACPTVSAPNNFEQIVGGLTIDGKPSNSGVKADGFITLTSGEAVVHGIDVSKWQDETNFVRAYECGARFAFVRLSGGTDPNNDRMYRIHWPNARAAGMLTGPYHNLSVLPKGAKRWLAADKKNRDQIFTELKSVAQHSAKLQAKMFLDRLDESLSLQPLPDRFTEAMKPSYLPIVLDLSYDPLPKASAVEREEYGEVFSLMACTFISTIQNNPKTAHAKLMLFAIPKIYKDYQLNQSKCGLDKWPVWISYHSTDGDRHDSPGAKGDRQIIEYLCNPKGEGDRCLFQQVTSFGGFAVFKPGAPFDVNRFYGSEEQLKGLLQTYGNGD